MLGSKKGISPSKASSVNPHESLSGLARFLGQELVSQAVDQGIKKFPTDALKSITGETASATPHKGDMEAGKAVDLRSMEKKSEKPKGEILGGIDYRREVVQGVQMRRSREQQQLEQRLNQIMDELKRLVNSTTTLSQEYATLSVDGGPVEAGQYHVNFFDFMISAIRTARMKVEDSGAWMAISKKKNGYQEKASSLGTKFTLSQERSTATQTG